MSKDTSWRNAALGMAITVAGVGFAAGQASAAISQSFDTDPTLATSQTPGAWYTDRFAPAAFESESFDGDNRLRHGINASDGANSRPSNFSSSFYNTQGRKFDIFAGVGSTMGIDLYIPGSWAETGRRMAGFWGTTTDSNGDISGFPIVEFASGSNLGPRFQIFTQDTDQDTSNGFTAGFISLGLPSGFTFNSWYRLETTLTANSYEFAVSMLGGGSVGYSDSVTLGSTQIDNVILQGHNTTEGVTYDIYWDNFTVETAAVPSPTPLALLGLGLAGIAAARRRK